MADETSGLLFQILLDQAAQADTERGLINIEKELGKLNDSDLERLSVTLDSAAAGVKILEDNFASARQESARLSQVSGNIARFSTGFVAAGTAIVGGIALSARQYVNFVEDAGIKGDETANKWIAATKRVKNAQLNLGEASAQVLLPVYEQLANLAEKGAAFAREHPELIKAGINVAAIGATVGALGLAVSKGIRLYADLKFIGAMATYAAKTDELVAAVVAWNTGAAVSNTGGGAVAGGALAKAGGVATIATLAVGELVLATTATNALLDAVGAPRLQEMFKAQADFLKGIPDVLSGKTNLNDLAAQVVGLAQASADARNKVGELGGGLRDFQNEADLAQATEAFISYRQQEAQAEQQYSQQRASLVQQGLEQINQLESNYVKQRGQLIAQYEQSSASALSSFNFQQAQAAAQFAQQEAQAEQQYYENRKKAQEDYQKQTERAAKDHQRALRKLQEEHDDRVRDLVASRDALGLSREKRDFTRRKRDLEEGYTEEKKRRQEDQRDKLREMDEQFAREREKRQADFEFRQQQAAEQFAFQQAQAKAQFEERLKQLDEQHKEEISKARQQNAEKLRELELAYRQEQITRRNAFNDILRDLNASLLNEEELRNSYYARMQADLMNFLQAATVNGAGSNLPGYQHGGYTPDNVRAIRTHPGEYVLDPQSTRSLEKMIGGRLTREGINAFAQGGGGSTTVNMQFPGGLITKKILQDSLDANTAKLLKNLTRGLA